MKGSAPTPPPIFRSLRFRLALSHGAVLALIALVVGAAAYALLARSLDRSATSEVSSAARDAAEHVDARGGAEAPADNDVPSSSSIRVALFLPDGTVLGERGESIPVWLRPQGASVRTIHALGERVRLATIPVYRQGHLAATVVAGRSLAPDDRLLHRVGLLFLFGGLAATLFAMTAGWILAGRAARPVRRAYEAQASFVSDASHELRTPLAFIRSGVEVLAEQDPELGDEVVQEVAYLADLTDRLLTMARTDSGSMTLDRRRVDVAAVCMHATRRAERALGLEGTVEVQGRPLALADAVALEAALDAVLENVVRYGGGRAEVTCREVSGGVRILVVDHGPGMTDGQREMAFERFFRADPVRTHDQSGAGLGLSLARTLVRAQGGEVRLEPTPGGGLTAAFELESAGGGQLKWARNILRRSTRSPAAGAASR